MTSDREELATYTRQTVGDTPSPADDWRTTALNLVVQYEQEQTAALLRRYRPELVAKFGQEAAAQILDHPYAVAFAASLLGFDIEPDEAVYRAAEYRRSTPGTSVAEAFTHVSLAAAQKGDADR